MALLTRRWTPLRPHPIQHQYWTSPHRFNVVSAGRRSGKTELAKRKLIKCAIRGTSFDNARFFAAAPIRDQAKRIYWNDLKKLIPDELVSRIWEGDLLIKLINDSEVLVLGMDQPARIEGQPWDGGILDEFANMKEGAWGENVRPALADRRGWCDLIGVPEGRNHYYDLDTRARAEMKLRGDEAEWGSFTWKSADILPQEEIEAARRDLHPKVFQQEYEGSFVDFAGMSIFELDKFLVEGQPVDYPTKCDAVFATIDTAVKDGKEHDGTAVTFWAISQHVGIPLIVLDWDITQIEGAFLEDWLPTVFTRLEQLAVMCGARRGSIGAFIEDKASGSILIQQAQRRGWPVTPLDMALTNAGKDGRALSVSGYAYQGLCKISAHAYDKQVAFKDRSRNHFLSQVFDFRIGAPNDRGEDDLADTFMYGLSIAFGDSEGN
jgi:phage terminase large subunit-like protein